MGHIAREAKYLKAKARHNRQVMEAREYQARRRREYAERQSRMKKRMTQGQQAGTAACGTPVTLAAVTLAARVVLALRHRR